METITKRTTESLLYNLITDVITLYEKRSRRRYFATLSNKMAKATKVHFAERLVALQHRLRTVWYQTESRASWITMRIFDTEEEQLLLADLFTPYYIEGGQVGSDEALRKLSRMVGRKVVYRGSTAWIHDNAIKFGKKYASSITKTTNQKIRNEIGKAINKGESLDTLMSRIKSVYRGVSDYRSEMIGRTEIGRSYNMSGLIQDRVVGVTSYDWVGCDPDCDICGPFMMESPHTAEEIEAFIMEMHPFCVGEQVPNIPENFEPKDIYA